MKIKGDYGNGIFHLFHRCGDGNSDDPVQPSDCDLPWNKRACGLRGDGQYQYLRAVLCLQCGTGLAADHFHEFWSRKGRTDPPDAQVRAWNGGFFWNLVDGALHLFPGTVYPFLHEPDERSACDCADDFPLLWNFLPVAAAEYLFHLLFPGSDAAKDSVYRFGGKRACHQRNSDLRASGRGGRKCRLVCDAGYGAGSCGLCHL